MLLNQLQEAQLPGPQKPHHDKSSDLLGFLELGWDMGWVSESQTPCPVHLYIRQVPPDPITVTTFQAPRWDPQPAWEHLDGVSTSGMSRPPSASLPSSSGKARVWLATVWIPSPADGKLASHGLFWWLKHIGTLLNSNSFVIAYLVFISQT